MRYRDRKELMRRATEASIATIVELATGYSLRDGLVLFARNGEIFRSVEVSDLSNSDIDEIEKLGVEVS